MKTWEQKRDKLIEYKKKRLVKHIYNQIKDDYKNGGDFYHLDERIQKEVLALIGNKFKYTYKDGIIDYNVKCNDKFFVNEPLIIYDYTIGRPAPPRGPVPNKPIPLFNKKEEG